MPGNNWVSQSELHSFVLCIHFHWCYTYDNERQFFACPRGQRSMDLDVAFGLVGFVMGDYFLFASYSMISARYSQLIMTRASPFAALAGFAIIGEKLSWMALAGMCVTLTGISISILKRENGNNSGSHNKLHMQLPVKGVLFALMGAIGQGLGIVLSKQGMLAYENGTHRIMCFIFLWQPRR
jgi:drug/metabolite transporter (DMT)-like permease